jgi:hypothetical protein
MTAVGVVTTARYLLLAARRRSIDARNVGEVCRRCGSKR